MKYIIDGLNTEQITNLYLYGRLENPANTSSDSLIHPIEIPLIKTTVQLDAVTFMTSGPGRFANGRQSPLVTAFMSGIFDPGELNRFGIPIDFVSGERNEYSAKDLWNLYPSSSIEKPGSFGIQQWAYDDGAGDRGERTYIYNSSGYRISNDAVFVIDSDGTRHIENYAILPLHDNFDFNSKDGLAVLGNPWLKRQIDPMGIGHRVDIKFDDASKAQIQRIDYSAVNYALDLDSQNATHHPIDGVTQLFGEISDEVQDFRETEVQSRNADLQVLWQAKMQEIFDSIDAVNFLDDQQNTAITQTANEDSDTDASIREPWLINGLCNDILLKWWVDNDSLPESEVNASFLEWLTGNENLSYFEDNGSVQEGDYGEESFSDSYPPTETLGDAEALGDSLSLVDDDTLVRIQAEEYSRVEIQNAINATEIREADLGVMQSVMTLEQAIQSGNSLAIAQAELDYLSKLEERAGLGPEGGRQRAGSLSDGAHSCLNAISSGIGLAHAIDAGNDWGIADQSVALLQNIDDYLDNSGNSYGDYLGSQGEALLGFGSSGIGLAQAMESGDNWCIAQSSVELLSGINNYLQYSADQFEGAAAAGAQATSNLDHLFDAEAGTTATALNGATSAIGLAMNISQLDEVLDSGDVGQITYTLASTANNAIGTYNAIAQLSGSSPLTSSGIPGLGYVAAAVQLMQGDVEGAAITAASTYLMCCGPVGWVAAAVLQVVSFMMNDDPPEASAHFAVDEAGHVTMTVSGDGSMQASARAYGNPMVAVMQNYLDNGGRVSIDGNLPSLKVEGGEDPRICYQSDSGGKISMILDDTSRAGVTMMGVLYARDRGDRLDEAVKLAKDIHGNIDISKVDAILAGQGFVKHGITYTFGETTERMGQSFGSGVVHGGGNVGPEGQLFRAKDADIVSLPLRPEQLPRQTLGEIIRVASLNSNFVGFGSELFIMGLGFGSGVFGIAPAVFATVAAHETNTDLIKPLDAAYLAMYEQGATFASPAPSFKADAAAIEVPDLTDNTAMPSFLESHWAEMLDGHNPFAALSANAALYYRETIGYNNLLSNGSKAPWWNDRDTDLPSRFHNIDPPALQATAAGSDATMQTGRSFSGSRITPEELPEDVVLPPPPPGQEQGVLFSMPEDSSLRFILSTLTDDQSSSYSASADRYEFVAFGAASHGRVWQEVNGDIRFEAEPGYVGNASFAYTLRNPAGDLVIRQASILISDVNDAPVLHDDAFVLNEGDGFYLDQLLANDIDPEGDRLSLDHFRGVEHGEVSYVNGRLLFTPEPGFAGTIGFSYWVQDRPGFYPVMAKACLTYLEQNGAPDAHADRFIIVEDHVLATTVAQLLANDRELDGESLEFVALGRTEHGTVEIRNGGDVIFTPNRDYAGNEAGFAYTVRDASGHIATGWAAVEVLDMREAPVVIATSHQAIMEDGCIAFTPDEIATFISDADGDTLRLDYLTNVVGGRITSENGILKFVADQDYHGLASFDYQANDNHRGVVQGHLEFAVTAVNDAINTGTDTLATTEEQALVSHINAIMANDTDVDGATFSFVSLGPAVHGTVLLDADGTITFNPERDYAGNEAGFTYVVEDSAGLKSTGFVAIAVTNSNDPPEIIANTLTLLEDQTITFDADTLARFIQDADGDIITLSSIEEVTGGTITANAGTYTFSPTANFNGAAFLKYSATDGNGAAISGTLALDILAKDDATVFGRDERTTLEDTPVVTTVAALLANDSDIDGKLEFVKLGAASHGIATVDADGAITFRATADYCGEDAGFAYIVRDAGGYEATGFVKVKVDNVNDSPEIISTSLSLDEDQPLSFDATTIAKFIRDIDGDVVSLTTIDTVTGGTISKLGGLYTFTPTPNYAGGGSLEYTASDGQGATVTGILNLDILSQDDATNFGKDLLATNEEQTVVTSVTELMGNDSDQDGSLTFVALGPSTYGISSLLPDGTITFTPTKDYFGDKAGFAYVVKDPAGAESVGWVTVQVANVNDTPEIINNRLHLYEDQIKTFSADEVAKFIVDVDGDALHLDIISNVEGGRLELTNGVYSFIPDENFYGDASFDYLARNGFGETLSGHMGIDISPINDLPKVAYSSAVMEEDKEITFRLETLLAGAVDVEDGSALRFGGIDSSLSGDVSVDADGLLHFLPDKDFFGDAFFRYNVLDSEGGVGTGYVGITVTGENDAPVAKDDDHILAWSNNSYENVYAATALLGNDHDADFDPLRIASLGPAEHGTVSLDALGNLHYVALSNEWVGIDTFSYRISDGNGGFAEAIATIDVKINTSPDAYSELIYTKEDVISFISQKELLANDSDVDGDTLCISAVGNAEHCSVELLVNGSMRFTPELNFNNRYPGQASFEYTVSDGISDPVTSVVFFNLEPVNDAPILQGERISGAFEDNAFSFTVPQLLANDSDVEMASPYEEDTIALAGVWGAGHGTVSWDGSTGTIYYSPNANFCGVETFSYAVVDSFGGQSIVQSEIYVAPVNDNPLVREDIGSPAEDCIWNYYRISSLLANDFDVDGDSLSLVHPHVSQGHADIKVQGGYLMVKPAKGEDRVEIGYTVSDGHGGIEQSKLTINQIIPHNFAPTFSGLYTITHAEDYNDQWGEFSFSFHVEDENGGDNWTIINGQHQMGDIAAIAPAQFHHNYTIASLTGQSYGHFTLSYTDLMPSSSTSGATFTITATDYAGATGTIYVSTDRMHKTVGQYMYSPVILDLDGDGIELLAREQGVGFDWDLDGETEKTGWVGRDDAILVYDSDRNGLITRANEMALREYSPEASTDLEGLRFFDSNGDGVFDGSDEKWADFGLWQDTNSDAFTDEGEFHSLDEMGIISIELTGEAHVHELAGNTVYGSVEFHRADGTTGEAGDVALAGETIEFIEVESPSSAISDHDADQNTSVPAVVEIPATDASLEDLIADEDSQPPDAQDALSDSPLEVNTEANTTEVETTEPPSEHPPEAPLVSSSEIDAGTEIEAETMGEAECNRIAIQLQSDAATYFEEASSEETSVADIGSIMIINTHEGIDAHGDDVLALT